MQAHRSGSLEVSAVIALGCMRLGHAYGPGPHRQEALTLVHNAFDQSRTHFDGTAGCCGDGSESILVGSPEVELTVEECRQLEAELRRLPTRRDRTDEPIARLRSP